MQRFHPEHVLLLREADLREAAEARSHHQVRFQPARRLRASLLRRRHRDLGHFDPAWALCAELNDRERQRFEDYFTITELDAGSSLGEQGTPVKNFTVVVSGQVGVSVDGNGVSILEPGSHFGSLQLLGDEPVPVRLASFVCLTAATVASVRRPGLREIVDRYPTVGKRLRATARIRSAYFAGRADAYTDVPLPAEDLHHSVE